MIDGVSPRSARAAATGESLIASGLVPMTSRISVESSLPPSSAGAVCLQSTRSSTKIVGVGLQLQFHRRGGNEVVGKAVLVAISDRCFLARAGDPHLGVGISGTVPAG